MNRKQPKLPKPDRSAWRYPAFLLAVVALGFLVMDFNTRMAELRRLTIQREEVRARATMHLETVSALQLQILHATSDAAVLEWAYGEAHMVRPGDHPVIPIPQGEVTPTPTPTVVITPTQASSLDHWMELFTGPVAPAP